ncbi:MAG: phenylalanine--tRNA ligase subunit beta [Betaproteobacteria bacterium]
MKVSFNWLKELVDISITVEELAHVLTMAGLEVEEITPVSAAFSQIVVAEVKSTSPHPNADKLRICDVDAGTGSTLQIVCGAPNVTPGMRVPCALVGAKLPGLEIKAAKLRGIESNGMLCSARELGLSDEHAGLLVLPDDAPVGQDIRKYLDLDDTYLTLKMTPNRGDCLSMIGIARDLAAISQCKLTLPVVPVAVSDVLTKVTNTISAPNACGRYLGRVIAGMNLTASSPAWMQRRLERAGFRSISPLVDITNYVNLERGQPMHAFDYHKLNGTIDARFAKAGEVMTLLNSQQVQLQSDMLVIADDNGPIALAGVMGGLDSMVTRDTTDVLFESAYFSPEVIQGKARGLGINSDAAYRFERGVDPEGARNALEYATQLAMSICGGKSASAGPIVEAVGNLPERKAVIVRPARVVELLGMNIGMDEMQSILVSLQCQVTVSGGVLSVTPPAYRFDMNIEEDFIEEIARIHGYANVPADPPVYAIAILPISGSLRTKSSLRHELVGLGYQEVINYSFTPPEWEADFAGNFTPVKVANPISSQMSVMRSNLIGGLIASVKHNINHGETRLKLFELGRCFQRDETNLDAQPEVVGGIAYGARFPEQWGEGGLKGAPTDFFTMKGEVETLLRGLQPRFEKASICALHPGRSAKITVGGAAAGLIGELHPQWQQKYDLPSAPILFEIDLSVLKSLQAPTFEAISRMPVLRRDIAVVIEDSVEIQSLADAVRAAKVPTVIEFSPFDIYRGSSVGFGKKSVAFRILMQDTDRTLVDSEADDKVSEILKVINKEFGATLRK